MPYVWTVEGSVFSTYAGAKLVADAINAGETYGEKAEVVKRTLDPAVAELRAGMKQYRVLMLHNGNVERCKRVGDVSGSCIEGEARIWRRTKAPAYKGKGIPDVLDATVWARSRKHAVEIVNGKRAQMIARCEW